MIDPYVYACLAIFVAIILYAVTKIGKSLVSDAVKHEGRRGRRNREETDADVGDVQPVAPARRRGGGARQRLRRTRNIDEDEDEEVALEDGDDITQDWDDFGEEKIGAKKLRKLQEKAEKRARREAEVAERDERKKKQEEYDQLRKEREDKEKEDEEKREAEEKKRKEEEEAREYEEYLKLKAAFSVEEEGEDATGESEDPESLLQEFINYIMETKVVMLEDLAARFKIKTQDCIDRIETLLDDGRLSGVMDDRGKFIYIKEEELEAVAKFIKQRGRVSISELQENSNRLINLNPDVDRLKREVGT